MRAESATQPFIVAMVKNGQTNTGDMAPVVIADGQNSRTLAMRWGFEPHGKRRGPRFLVRDDSVELEAYVRCLVPATALPLTDREGRKWIVTLEEDGSIFCFAGVCKQATASWPDAYATVTVSAYPDLKSIKRRHIAILPQACWAQWLAGAPAKNILKPWPPHSFRVMPE